MRAEIENIKREKHKKYLFHCLIKILKIKKKYICIFLLEKRVVEMSLINYVEILINDIIRVIEFITHVFEFNDVKDNNVIKKKDRERENKERKKEEKIVNVKRDIELNRVFDLKLSKNVEN